MPIKQPDSEKEMECPYCEGSGLTENFNDCSSCKGSGKIRISSGATPSQPGHRRGLNIIAGWLAVFAAAGGGTLIAIEIKESHYQQAITQALISLGGWSILYVLYKDFRKHRRTPGNTILPQENRWSPTNILGYFILLAILIPTILMAFTPLIVWVSKMLQ